MQQLRQTERSDEAMLMTSATDHGGSGFSPPGRSERYASRWAVGEVLAMTLGLLGVFRMRAPSAVRTRALPGTGDRLRSTLLVKSGTDPNRIQLAYQGVTAIRSTEAGRLEVSISVGSFAEEMPGCVPGSGWTTGGGGRNLYILQTSEDTSVYGIHVGAERAAYLFAITSTLTVIKVDTGTSSSR